MRVKTRRPKVKINHADRLENSSTSSSLDTLLYGLGSKIVNHHSSKMGLPEGVAMGALRNPLADLATRASEEVRKMGIDPALIGLGLLVAVNVYQQRMIDQTSEKVKELEARVEAPNSSSPLQGSPLPSNGGGAKPHFVGYSQLPFTPRARGGRL